MMPVLKETAADTAIFAALRASCAFIAADARHVRIDMAKLEALAAALPNRLPDNVFDDSHHFVGSPADTAAYILALDSINFGSGYKAPLVAEGWHLLDDSLYFTVSTRLKSWFETHGPLSAAALASMVVADFCRIIDLDFTQPYAAEFASLCVHSFNEMGALVEGSFGGNFLALVDSAEGSAGRLIGRLSGLDSFNDVYTYHGHTVCFYKRAQSTAADLQDAFRRFDRDLFHDIGQLTILADNDVPHVLKVDGVLAYTPELEKRIQAGIPLPAGSDEEIEIRGCAAQAAELIARAKGMTPITLDRILWHRSAEDDRYRRQLSHRTLFRFY